jgi:Spy/CpxP family protein refolding chaperone
MKKFLIALIVLAAAGPVMAQAPEGTEGGPPPIAEASHNAVVNFLKLTPEQVAEWDVIYMDHRDAEQPLQEAIREVQEVLDALLEEENPDPAAIGELVIDRRELGEQLFDVHMIYHEAFVALLEENQVKRLRLIARADDVQRFIPAFKLFELIPRR